MNRVRRALSSIKGGRLAAAVSPAQLVTYIISDVPGDDPAVVGSGPTIPDAVDPEDVLKELKAYRIAVSDRIEAAIRANMAADAAAGGEVHMIATPRSALVAAAAKARELGLNPLVLGDAIEGEAREVATVMAGIARSVALYDDPVAKPCVLLSGGETTVTVRGNGRGGRNAEFLLALAVALKGEPWFAALACDTDGIDGSEDNAGAWIDSASIEDAQAKGIDLPRHLAENDAYSAFSALGRLIRTGPTLTNVNDFRAIVVR
jgi:hydroxypyruvate reductase